MCAWPTRRCISARRRRDSYLLIDKIIAACKQTGAQAVHPGYGFLSENPKFPKRWLPPGIIFIGPPVKARSTPWATRSTSKKLAG
jgi:propionyl-CoA carboxylase alpha chain